MRWLRTCAAFGLAVGMTLIGPAATFGKAAKQLELGADAPMFVLKTMNPALAKSKRFVLRDFVGEAPETPRRAVVLSFAASYCEPCKRELAELKGMQKELEGGQVQLAVVVIDKEPEGIEAMRKLTVDKLALPYPVLSDRFGVLARRYFAEELPMTVVIDRRGKVRWVQTGFAEGALDRLRTQLGLKS